MIVEMKSKPTFQFSALDKSLYSRLQKAIKKLEGNYDTTKFYSSSATHLIVDKIVCTEKILCFISSGKWIVTQSYIKNCLKESKFLNESPFQASSKFPNSKLAKISIKWKQGISQSQLNYPFYGWDVAIFVDNNEKANALSRIIRAGMGNFACLGNTTRFNRSFSSRFSLVIYDNITKFKAIEFAKSLNIKYYPFQCISDYLIQGIRNDGPILSIEYYEKLNLPSNIYFTREENEETNNNLNEINLNSPHHYKDQNLNKFKILFSKCNKSSKETIFLDDTINDHFMNLWSNKAYYEAFFVLSKTENNALPSQSLMTELFEFLLTNSSAIKKHLKLKTNNYQTADSIYIFLYQKILSYLTLKVLNYPSFTNERYKYFSEIFKNLILDFRICEVNQKEVKGIVDVMYLICIHDFLIMNDKSSNSQSLFQNLKLDETKKIFHLLKTVLTDKRPIDDILAKILEMLAFIDVYLGKTKFYRKILKNYQVACTQDIITESSLRHIFISSINEF